MSPVPGSRPLLVSKRDRSNRKVMRKALKKFLVVSVHDVSPLTWRSAQQILQALAAAGIIRRSLLLIPNHQGRAAVDEAPEDFQAWLREVSQQDEICLHGYEHQAPTLPGGPWARLVATMYTDREGEFYRQDGEEATRRLQAGLRHFDRLGLRPEGFVAPAWLLSRESEAALRRLGFQYTTRLRSIDLFTQPSKRLRAPALCYSVRSGWRRALSQVWNPALFQLARRSAILRIAIHPADLDHPAVFRQILRLARQAARERTVATYREVIEQTRKQEVPGT